MTIRGFAIAQFTSWSAVDTATSPPISDASFQVQRNPMVEKSMSEPGEPKIYGGTYGVSGSVSMSYRPSVAAVQKIICCGIFGKDSVGTVNGLDALDNYQQYFNIANGDEFGRVDTFASCVFTSMELNLQAGDFAKISFNWVGQRKASSDLVIGGSDSAANIPVFYNAVLTVGGAPPIKCKGITLRVNRPINAQDFVIGSEYSQSLIQSDSATIEGTLTLSPKEVSMLTAAVTTNDETNWGNLGAAKIDDISLGELLIELNDPSGGTEGLGTITLSNIYVSDLSSQTSGRNPIDRTLNYKATSTATGGITWTFSS